MVRRGRKPRPTAWRVTEKAPEALDRLGIPHDQCTLAEVVERQRRKGEEEPGTPDRPVPEVPHVGVERLRARDGEHDRAERDERGAAVFDEELRGIGGRQRAQDGRVLRHFGDPAEREDPEPQPHHGPEQPADDPGPEALDDEQRREDGQRDRHHERVERGRDHLESLDRRQDGDRRRDHAVAVKQGGAEDAERDEHDLRRASREPCPLDQGDQGHDAALAVVVRAHDERHVLDRDDDRDRPEDQRQHAVDGRRRRGHLAVVGVEDGLQRVQRARADVTEDHAERTEGQRRDAGAGVAGRAALPGPGLARRSGSPGAGPVVTWVLHAARLSGRVRRMVSAERSGSQHRKPRAVAVSSAGMR